MNPVTVHSVNADQDRDSWLALRRRYLSATDWPKLTGASPWAGPEDVVRDKLGLLDTGCEWSLPMRVGKALEPLIVERALARFGPGQPVLQAFLSHGHLGFTPDLVLVRPGADWVLGEIKVSVKDWKGRVPEVYLDQVRFQATVLGVDEVTVIHLQLASWEEGLAFLDAGEVPAERLAYHRVRVGAAERRKLQAQAEAWWEQWLGSRAGA
jgi:predicted phage-related endonuclease